MIGEAGQSQIRKKGKNVQWLAKNFKSNVVVIGESNPGEWMDHNIHILFSWQGITQTMGLVQRHGEMAG